MKNLLLCILVATFIYPLTAISFESVFYKKFKDKVTKDPYSYEAYKRGRSFLKNYPNSNNKESIKTELARIERQEKEYKKKYNDEQKKHIEEEKTKLAKLNKTKKRKKTFAKSSSNKTLIPSMSSANYGAYCKEKWTKIGKLNHRMYEYCLKKEKQGHAELKYLVNKYKDKSWIKSALKLSIEKWTKKGSRQDSMVHYSLKSITDGFEEIQYKKSQSSFNYNKEKSCLQKWGVRYDMVWYCYKK